MLLVYLCCNSKLATTISKKYVNDEIKKNSQLLVLQLEKKKTSERREKKYLDTL